MRELGLGLMVPLVEIFGSGVQHFALQGFCLKHTDGPLSAFLKFGDTNNISYINYGLVLYSLFLLNLC